MSIRRTGAALVTFLVLVIGASSAPGQDQQTFSLKLNLHRGDAWSFDRIYDMKAKMNRTDGGVAQQVDIMRHERIIGTAMVLAVENGLPTAMRINFDKQSEMEDQLPGERSTTHPYPLAGLTVTVRRAGAGAISIDPQPQVDPAIIKELEAWVDPDLSIYPKDPVLIGQQWPGNPTQLAKTFDLSGPDDQATMTVKLLDVDQVEGRTTAHVQVTTTAYTDSADTGTRKITVDGGMELDLASGRPIYNDQKGTLSMSGITRDQAADGQVTEIRFQGAGPLSILEKSGPPDAEVAAAMAGVTVQSNPGPAPAPPGPAAAAPAATSALEGHYTGTDLSADVQNNGVSGVLHGKTGDYPFMIQSLQDGQYAGVFRVGKDQYNFTMTYAGSVMTLSTGGKVYSMTKATVPAQPPNPLGNNAPAAPAQPTGGR